MVDTDGDGIADTNIAPFDPDFLTQNQTLNFLNSNMSQILLQTLYFLIVDIKTNLPVEKYTMTIINLIFGTTLMSGLM